MTIKGRLAHSPFDRPVSSLLKINTPGLRPPHDRSTIGAASNERKGEGRMWLLFACGSALFAGLTSILAKCGIRRTDSTVATALRTVVVLLFAWLLVLLKGGRGSSAPWTGRRSSSSSCPVWRPAGAGCATSRRSRADRPASSCPSTSSVSSSRSSSPSWSSTRGSRPRPSWPGRSSCSCDQHLAQTIRACSNRGSTNPRSRSHAR